VFDHHSITVWNYRSNPVEILFNFTWNNQFFWLEHYSLNMMWLPLEWMKITSVTNKYNMLLSNLQYSFLLVGNVLQFLSKSIRIRTYTYIILITFIINTFQKYLYFNLNIFFKYFEKCIRCFIINIVLYFSKY